MDSVENIRSGTLQKVIGPYAARYRDTVKLCVKHGSYFGLKETAEFTATAFDAIRDEYVVATGRDPNEVIQHAINMEGW